MRDGARTLDESLHATLPGPVLKAGAFSEPNFDIVFAVGQFTRWPDSEAR